MPRVEQEPGGGAVARAGNVLPRAWLGAVLVVTAALVALRSLGSGTVPAQVAAAALGTLLAAGLAFRSGGPPAQAALLAAVVGAAAVTLQWDPLLAGAALGTAVLAACLALLGTVPAPSTPVVIREVVLAQLLATSGALAVAGFSADTDRQRFFYTALGISLVAAIALVYRLGAGLHGLGGRGVLVAVGGVVLLGVAIAYTEALARYGSPDLVGRVETLSDWTAGHLGGVPHPIETVIGFPALAWGVAMRSRRRQGWWVCAFGAAATAPTTTRLLHTDASWSSLLAAVYSLGLGLLLGLVVIRVSRAVARNRRRHPDPAAALRPEPPRLSPLH